MANPKTVMQKAVISINYKNLKFVRLCDSLESEFITELKHLIIGL